MRFRKVLVVDDCVTTRKVLAKGLREAGYQVTTASDGLEALAMINKSPPDYVVTDWRMPSLDGESLCRRIRSAKHKNYTYLILMTAHSEVLDLVDGLGAGTDDYITKPVEMRELLARMKSGARILDLDRRLTYVADHDPLTGMLNRRNLIDSADQMITSCREKDHPVSCIMLDLDFFKQINDQYGHLAGDSVLVQAADLLRKRFRASDCVCRYGGEEFVAILPECNEEGAANSAERCRVDIESLVSLEGTDTRVTASFGVAELGTNDLAIQLIENADIALLSAKETGRNQVIRFSQLPSELANAVPATERDVVFQSVTG